jgi:hypothetical protein
MAFASTTDDSAEHQTPAPKRFLFAPRPPAASMAAGNGTSTHDELSTYNADLEHLTEDTDAVQYWLSKESQYKYNGGLALDLDHLVAAPASQAYVERLFSVCGDLTARKRNRTKASLENRVFLKLNCAMMAKLPKAEG